MTEWSDTSWTDNSEHTKFIDKNDCWWHRWSGKQMANRVKRRAKEIFERARDWGRRPYIDGSNWGVKSQTEKRSRGLTQERALRQERRHRGKKI